MNLFELFITQPIFNLLLVIYGFIGDFGVAIIVFTIIVKIALWPLTKGQLHQTKLMRKLQPELKKIRKNSNGNKQMESLQMMDLYRRNNVKPFRSMLMLFIQLPILLTIYSVVRIITYQPDQVSRWAYQPVSQISRIGEAISNRQFDLKLFGIFDLKDSALPLNDISSWFLLFIAISLGISQWWMVRQTQPKRGTKNVREIFKEAAEGKEPDQSELNAAVTSNMNLFLPAILFITFINLYGALTFYYFISNIIQIIQQKYVFSMDSKEMEEMASEKSKNREKNAKEAKIIDKTSQKPEKNSSKDNHSSNIRRIKAKDGRRKK